MGPLADAGSQDLQDTRTTSRRNNGTKREAVKDHTDRRLIVFRGRKAFNYDTKGGNIKDRTSNF